MNATASASSCRNSRRFSFSTRAKFAAIQVKGTYLFRGDESFFAGHFRDEPIVPASIVYEALGQAGCLWVLEQVPKRLSLSLPANHVLFVGMDEARFSRRAKPGTRSPRTGNDPPARAIGRVQRPRHGRGPASRAGGRTDARVRRHQCA